jgi:hypothetical protein
MFDPTPEMIEKVTQNLGSGLIGNTIGVMVLIACGLAWWRGEPRGKNDERDLSALLLKHDALKSMKKIESLLDEAVSLLQALDRGQKYSHKWFEALWNDQAFSPPARKKRIPPGPPPKD